MSPKNNTQYFELLKKCIEEKKAVLDILKGVPKEQYVDLGKLINPFIEALSKTNNWTDADYYDERKSLLFQIKYFFESTGCLKDYYLPNYEEELDALVQVYIRPDLHEIISNSHIDYSTRMAYFKKGYINMEERPQIGMALLRLLRPYGEESIEGTLKKIYDYEAALTHHIWLTFDPFMYLDSERTKWEKLLIRFIEDGKVEKHKVFMAILGMDVSATNLSAVGSSHRQSEIGVISWYFKVMKSMKPASTNLLKLQDRLLEILDTPLPGAKNVTLGFVKQIAGESDFKSTLFVKKVKNILPAANLTQAKIILSTLGLMIKKDVKKRKVIIATAHNGLSNPDGKVQTQIQKFLKKFADQSMVESVETELKKRKQPKELTTTDLGGWTEEEIIKISQLLLSVEDRSVKVAFALLENRDFPRILLSEVFAIGKLTEDKELSKIAETIIKEHGSDTVIKLLDSKLSLGTGNSRNSPTEKTIKKNIHTYVKDNELDGLKIAQALYKKDGIGISFLLDDSKEENQKEIYKTFINGTTLKLTGVALTKFPPVIFEFPELTVIDLSGNKIGAIPAKINVFKHLRILKLDNNSIKTIQKNIASLTTLEELYLNDNKVKDGIPAHLFELINLKKLDLTDCQDQSIIYELPMSILNLKNLEFFKLDYEDWHRTHDSYSNYPQIKEVTGHPINMEPLAIAEAAFDQGDISPTSYIFKHGDAKLKKKVLDYYYDLATKTMDFQEHFVARLPEEILNYDIEILNLNRCGMGKDDSYPDHEKVDLEELAKTELIAKMQNLRELYLGMNRFTELSDLSGLTRLKKLVITDMSITKLFDLSSLQNIQQLKLGSLNLTELPPALFGLTKLTHLNLNGAFRRSKVKFTFKDFEEIKNLKNLKNFVLGSRNFKEEYEYEQVKAFLPEGCAFSEY